MAKYIISCRPGSYGKFSLHAFEHLAEIGVKFVELEMPSSDEDAKFKLEMFEDISIKALSLCFPINIDDKKVVDKFKETIPIIKKFNPMYIFSSVKIKKENKRQKGYPILAKIGEIAKENNIFISVETHPYYNTNGDRGVETMKAVNHPNVKINYDSANIYYYNEGVDGIAELKKVLPYLGSVHVKDCMKRYHDWAFPEIGLGKVEFPELFKLMDTLDRTISLTLEIEGVKGEQLNLEQTKERVKNSVEYLKKLNLNFT